MTATRRRSAAKSAAAAAPASSSRNDAVVKHETPDFDNEEELDGNADAKLERRRMSHVAFERRRREDLRVCFERLAATTPGCSMDQVASSSRPYKCHIVLKTIEHVKNLEAQIEQLNARLAASTAQLHALGIVKEAAILESQPKKAAITELP